MCMRYTRIYGRIILLVICKQGSEMFEQCLPSEESTTTKMVTTGLRSGVLTDWKD